MNKKTSLFLFFVTMLALWLNVAFSLAFFGVDYVLRQVNFDIDQYIYTVMGIGLTGAIGAVFFSAMIARFMVGVTLIRVPSTYLEKWLFTSIERQSRQLGISMPKIGVFYASDLNAFTTGWGQRNAMFAVSSGLLETLDQDELEAVIGHELAHIENGDMVSLAMTQGIVVSLSLLPARIFGFLIDELLLRRNNREGFTYRTIYWLCMLLFAALPHFVVMWFSRKREFSADTTSAIINGADKMISALKRLSKNTHHSLLSEQITALGITSGVFEGLAGRMSKLSLVFCSHPSLIKRINAIEKQLINYHS